jgi:predicted AlkP superfamily pyrophosphatase or phosphodiesterase
MLVSVDGMKPDYVLRSDALHLKIPFLRGLLADGAYATGVIGVWPTVTYPSHTTLVTGVTPAEHGIFNNLEFDPKRNFAESWYWYSPQIKVPTLWRAAHLRGLITASIGWPVTVGNGDVDFLIPEYWRIFRPTEDLNPSDRYLIAALSHPAGMLAELQRSIGPYLMGNDVSRDADAIKTRFAAAIWREHKPRFMTVHLSSLDEAEHEHGPFSPEADETMEAIDSLLSTLASAARAADPSTLVIVASDHGFVELQRRVNLYIPFIKAGLLDVAADGPTTRVNSWRAQPWLAGGMAAIMLRDPADQRTAAEVRALLDELKSDPSRCIAEVLDHDAAGKRGAFPDASFLLVLRPGCYAGSALAGDLITEFGGHGGHGFSPDEPSMRAAFFIAGNGIARHRELGVVDMRQIAPTVAQLLGVRMPSATAAPLSVRQ